MVVIGIDHRREFDQDISVDFYDKNGISHNFLALRTLQQNEVVAIKKQDIRRYSENLNM